MYQCLRENVLKGITKRIINAYAVASAKALSSCSIWHLKPMKCKHCSSESLIRKGIRGIKQRYKCKACGKYQQNIYTYKRYDSKDDVSIKLLNAEGVGIRSISRILGYSCGTIIRRIQFLAIKVIKPVYLEFNQVYEVDEMWTFVGKKHPSCFSWITYAMNRRTNEIIDVAFGSRSKKNLK